MELLTNLKRLLPTLRSTVSYKLVKVRWVDAETGDGWEHIDELECEAPVVTTIGYLVKETPTAVMVASTIDKDHSMCNARIVIPRGMVLEIKNV